MTLRQYRNGPATTLTSGIGPSDTAMTVDDASGFPALFPYTLIVDVDEGTEEVVDVTAAAGNLLTITRAADGTTAFLHAAGAVIAHGTSARDAREANAHVNATSDVHGVVGALAAATHTHDDRYFTESEVTASLALKANTSHTHATGDINTGTFSITRIPTGTTSSTVSLGNHTHASGGTGPDMQVFTSSGTWTKPADAVKVWVQVVGGGGGGEAGDDPLGINGGGGGAAAYTSSMLDAADCNSTEAVTIGAGGAGGSGSASADGTEGGITTFDTIPGSVWAEGGAGGGFTGGLGGNEGVGDLVVHGGYGHGGSTGSNETGGVGGASFFGGGGRGGTGPSAGLSGAAYGSGGGGGGESGNRAGGAGAGGLAIITTYF